jgi:predicted DNA-binding WGR domain protein
VSYRGFAIEDFAWNYDPEKNADKIWGIASIDDRFYSFWGKRGNTESSLKAIKFLRADEFELRSTLREKIRKGYSLVGNSVNLQGEYPDIEKVYPGFVSHARQALMLAKLDGSVRREGSNASS